MSGSTGEVQLQQKAIPEAVFGGARDANAAADKPQMGALERLKKRKTVQ